MTARRIVVAVLALAASVTVGIYAQGGGGAAAAQEGGPLEVGRWPRGWRQAGRLVHLSPATSSPAPGVSRRSRQTRAGGVGW